MNPVSRRRFLAVAGGASVAAAAGSFFPRTAWAGPLGWPSGIQLYTVGKPLQEDAAGTLKQLHEIGYREVETAGSGKLSSRELRALLDDAGLTCPSAHLQLTGADLDSAFADAHALGAHYAVSSVLRTFSPAFIKAATAASGTDAQGAGGPPKRPPMEPLGLDGFKKMAAHMNEVGQKAHAAGLQYAYHNHNFEFEKMPDGTPGYDVLVKETDLELVKFEIDCGWMVVAGGDPAAYFAKYPGRFRMLHIKDFQPVAKPTTELTGAGRPQGSDLGKGFIDYKPIFAAAKSAGIEHIFAEQEAPFTVSQIESAKLDYAFLQKFN
jgi:sugar phosphate isomerase/epimerase